MTGHRLFVVVKAGKVVDAFLSEEMAREVQLDIGDDIKWRKDVWVELRYFASHGTRMPMYDMKRPGFDDNEHSGSHAGGGNTRVAEKAVSQELGQANVDVRDSNEGEKVDSHPVSTP